MQFKLQFVYGDFDGLLNANYGWNIGNKRTKKAYAIKDNSINTCDWFDSF